VNYINSKKAYIKQHGKCYRENLLFIAVSHSQKSPAHRLCIGAFSFLAACQEQRLEEH